MPIFLDQSYKKSVKETAAGLQFLHICIHKSFFWQDIQENPGEDGQSLYTLSRKQFGKYLTLEIFPASLGIVQVFY
jgi:hypothetical protein